MVFDQKENKSCEIVNKCGGGGKFLFVCFFRLRIFVFCFYSRKNKKTITIGNVRISQYMRLRTPADQSVTLPNVLRGE